MERSFLILKANFQIKYCLSKTSHKWNIKWPLREGMNIPQRERKRQCVEGQGQSVRAEGIATAARVQHIQQ